MFCVRTLYVPAVSRVFLWNFEPKEKKKSPLLNFKWLRSPRGPIPHATPTPWPREFKGNRRRAKNGADLAKPTPLLLPLESRRMRVDMTWPKCFSMFSSSCSSMDSGRLEMYKLVGSCSCCCSETEKKTRPVSRRAQTVTAPGATCREHEIKKH